MGVQKIPFVWNDSLRDVRRGPKKHTTKPLSTSGLAVSVCLVLRVRVKGHTANLGEPVGTERLLLETLEGRRQRAKATWDPRLRNDFGWG